MSDKVLVEWDELVRLRAIEKAADGLANEIKIFRRFGWSALKADDLLTALANYEKAKAAK